jgi:hypothetical protein
MAVARSLLVQKSGWGGLAERSRANHERWNLVISLQERIDEVRIPEIFSFHAT